MNPALQTYLQEKVIKIQRVWGFDPYCGYVQVETIAKALNETIRDTAFFLGQLFALLDLAQTYGVKIDPLAFPHTKVGYPQGFTHYALIKEPPQ